MIGQKAARLGADGRAKETFPAQERETSPAAERGVQTEQGSQTVRDSIEAVQEVQPAQDCTKQPPQAAETARTEQTALSAKNEEQSAALSAADGTVFSAADERSAGQISFEVRGETLPAAQSAPAEELPAKEGHELIPVELHEIAEEPSAKAPAERRRGRAYFTASRIAKLALLTALAYVVTFLEFPIFLAAPFLQLDFSNVFVLLGGFLYGPLASVIVSLLKECLSLLDSGTGGIGELANFLINFAFYIVPTLVYRYRKGLKWVIPMLAVGVVLQIGAGLLVNRYINFPLYMGAGAAASFAALWWYIILFNLIKGVAVSAVTVLLYKRISWLFKKF